MGDKIESNTKYSDLVVLLENTLEFNGVCKLFYKVPDMDLRIDLVCLYSDIFVSEIFCYIQKISFIDMFVFRYYIISYFCVWTTMEKRKTTMRKVLSPSNTFKRFDRAKRMGWRVNSEKKKKKMKWYISIFKENITEELTKEEEWTMFNNLENSLNQKKKN